MSVRVWLMMADCLHCGVSIELTPEEQRRAEQLLAGNPQGPSGRTPPSAEKLKIVAPVATLIRRPQESRPAPASSEPQFPPAQQKKPHFPVAKLVKPGPAIPPPLPAQPPPLPKIPPSSPAGRLRRPLWPILLALLCIAGASYALWALLRGGSSSTFADASGEKPAAKKPLVPSTWRQKRETAQVSGRSTSVDLQTERAAEELTLPRDATAGLPELSKVIEAVNSTSPARMLEGRDPRIRRDVVEGEGGSVYTEAAVAAGLRWLHRHQATDGSWSLDRFDRAGDCDGQCDGQGEESDVAATALALLPFLGAGQSHKRGEYQDDIDRGLQRLVGHQQADGSLQGQGVGRMYAHGLATIVLCEALAMSRDDSLRPPAQRAVDFIVRAQHPGGGWRYHPGEEGDLSVVGWQLMALQAGRTAHLDVPQSAFDGAGRFLDTVKGGRRGGLFSYQPWQAETPAMTAEGLLCRQYLGWPQDHPGLREGINRMIRDALPNKHRPNIYYWYYGTQVVHHVGGEPWKKWNAAVREALLAMQEKEGHPAGSWAPRGGAIGDIDTRTGGRIYMTALALCTLEVYYRYLPLYRGIEIRQ